MNAARGDEEVKVNWFQKHLNLTLTVFAVGTYLLTMVGFAPAESTEQERSMVGLLIQLVNPAITNETMGWFYLPTWLALMLPVEGWVLSKKNRSLWHLLWAITPFGWIIILFLKNQSQFQTSTIVRQSKEKIKMGFISKARTGTGLFVQIIGGILFIGSGLTVFIWELYVLFEAFGAWTILIGLIFAPITYFAAILIVWFTTGAFPVIVLILWLTSWIGAGIVYLGSRVSGE